MEVNKMIGMIVMFIIIGAVGVVLVYVGCDTDCAVVTWIGYVIATLAIPTIILVANFTSIGM